MKATVKFNRCVEFTLPNGQTVEVKVMGKDTAAAAAQAKALVLALSGGA